MASDERGAPCSMLSFHFDRSVYDLETVQRAAYRFTDRCSFDFATSDRETICSLSVKPDQSADIDMAQLEGDFKNEVLDQHLRKTVSDETAAVRNAILAHAFSRTGLQDSE